MSVWGSYTHEGERYVYPTKPHRVADWAERRPKEECPHCGRHKRVYHRRVDRTGLVVGLLRRLLGTTPARRKRVRTWWTCEECGDLEEVKDEVTAL